jgi:hypothetical protein
MTKQPTAEDLAATRANYMRWMRTEWDVDDLARQGENLVFCYAVWGGAFANLPGKDWLKALRANRAECVPAKRQQSWDSVRDLAENVRVRSGGYNLLPWLMLPVGHRERWQTLQDVHMVGPKIAAWTLRDLSFWMDYRPVIGRREITLARKRDSSWFRALPDWAQAYYLPMDRWVHRGCVEHGVYTEAEVGGSFNAVQSTPERHEEAARRLAAWCIKYDLDAREVNVHWFSTGSKGE